MSTPYTVDCKINKGDILLLLSNVVSTSLIALIMVGGEDMFLGGISLISLQYELLRESLNNSPLSFQT